MRFFRPLMYMSGPGGRFGNNVAPSGLTLSSLKHHVALQPLFAIMGLGMIMVGAYLGRLAIKTTDVSWKKEEQPYNYYRNKQFKFLNPSGYDYSKFGNEIPNYQKEEK